MQWPVRTLIPIDGGLGHVSIAMAFAGIRYQETLKRKKHVNIDWGEREIYHSVGDFLTFSSLPEVCVWKEIGITRTVLAIALRNNNEERLKHDGILALERF